MSALRRVTVTLPAEVVKAADALAASLDRSRSWVVAEALRRYAGLPRSDARTTDGTARGAAVGEEAPPPYDARRAFRAAELSRLETDLALTPEQRVRIAEELLRTVPAGRRRPRHHRVVQFESFEDYLDWKQFADLAQ